MGLNPVTRDAAPAGKQYPYVLFAAPPSGSEDYPGAVSACITGVRGGGEGGSMQSVGFACHEGFVAS